MVNLLLFITAIIDNILSMCLLVKSMKLSISITMIFIYFHIIFMIIIFRITIIYIIIVYIIISYIITIIIIICMVGLVTISID